MKFKLGVLAAVLTALGMLTACQSPTSGVVTGKKHSGLSYELRIEQDDSPNPVWQNVPHSSYLKCALHDRYPNCTVK